MTLEQRYEKPEINRAYHLSDALIKMRSYQWRTIDKVGAECSDSEVAAFCKIITCLNKLRETEKD